MDTKSISIAESKNYYPYIDGLRGIAILMVVAVHTSQNLDRLSSEKYVCSYFEQLINSGARGVQLFFMVSAFTLFSSSFRRFSVDRFPIMNFYIRRAFRILPFWWIVVIIFWALADQSYQLLPSILFYFGFLRFNVTAEVVPGGWSLFVEECFYLLLPLIFTKIKCLRSSLFFAIACLIFQVVWSKGAPKMGVPASNDFIFLFPLNQWFCFAFGIFVYFIVNSEEFKSYKLSKIQAVGVDIVTLIALAALIIVPLVPATISLLLLFFAASFPTTCFGKITRNKILMRFGGYCYSIYLFHFLLLGFIDPYKTYVFNKLGVNGLPIDVRFFIYFPVVAFIALIIGFFSFNYIEKPCVRLGKKIIFILEGAVPVLNKS